MAGASTAGACGSGPTLRVGINPTCASGADWRLGAGAFLGRHEVSGRGAGSGSGSVGGEPEDPDSENSGSVGTSSRDSSSLELSKEIFGFEAIR
jgi:hypothetical protein